MSAETLRRAAALMRGRAEAATPGPWSWREEHGRDFTDEGWSYVAVETARGDRPGEYGEEIAATAYPGDSEGGEAQADADHIASWHPAVALAVADWLDAEAAALDALAKFSMVATTEVREFDIRGAAIAVSKGEDGSLGISADTSRSALAVARAYLGESA